MQEVYLLSTENESQSTAHGCIQLYKKATFTKLVVGDRVLVRNMSERGGPGKLHSFWEKTTHHMTKQHGDSPVYEVAPESGKGRTRVLHRNMLLPCDFLPVTETDITMVDPSQPNASTKRATKQDLRQRNTIQLQTRKVYSSSSEDDNFSWHFPVHVTSRNRNSGTRSKGSQLNTPTNDSTYRVGIEETSGSAV